MLMLGSKPASLDENGVLKCPKCNQTYLHHGEVAVFDRSEDETTTRVTHIQGQNTLSVLMPSEVSGNPSTRRHGATITFECESCDQDDTKQKLNIVQHKGETFLFWGE